MSAVLLVRSKITDLAAWTALETGRRLLPSGLKLQRLVREELYLFEPKVGVLSDAFEGPLAHAIESSNFFVNPNKEQYRLFRSAARGPSLEAPEGAWGIMARARDQTEDDGLRARLLREHPIDGLAAIRRARLWWLWTSGPEGGLSVEETYKKLGPVTGTRQGLLVNPHADVDLRIEKSITWSAVEAFLAAPAQALGSAA